jgi:hypothetical protein
MLQQFFEFTYNCNKAVCQVYNTLFLLLQIAILLVIMLVTVRSGNSVVFVYKCVLNLYTHDTQRYTHDPDFFYYYRDFPY